MELHGRLSLLAITTVVTIVGCVSEPEPVAVRYNGPSSRTFPVSTVGCFKDAGDSGGTPGRDLNGLMMTVSDMTVEQCTSTCASRGFTYAATQDSTQCFCGDSFGRLGASVACTSKCAGNPTETCGGVWANSVYQVGAPKSLALQPAAIAAPETSQTTFDLGEITVFDGTNVVVKLHRDGTAEVEDASGGGMKPGPTVSAEGTLDRNGWKMPIAIDRSLKPGKYSDNALPVRLHTDSISTYYGQAETVVALGPDGTVTYTGEPHANKRSLRVVGADTVGKRRLALTYLVLVLNVALW